jgi:hypothetical protein
VRLAPLLLALLLGGCFAGKPFYTAAQSEPVMAPGVYAVSVVEDGHRRHGRARVTIVQGTLERVEVTGEKPNIVGLKSVGGGRFVLWEEGSEPLKLDEDEIAYQMLEQRGAGRFRLSLLMCDAYREVAVAAGATVIESPKGSHCRFERAEQLEAAIRAVKPTGEGAVDLRFLHR